MVYEHATRFIFMLLQTFIFFSLGYTFMIPIAPSLLDETWHPVVYSLGTLHEIQKVPNRYSWENS